MLGSEKFAVQSRHGRWVLILLALVSSIACLLVSQPAWAMAVQSERIHHNLPAMQPCLGSAYPPMLLIGSTVGFSVDVASGTPPVSTPEEPAPPSEPPRDGIDGRIDDNGVPQIGSESNESGSDAVDANLGYVIVGGRRLFRLQQFSSFSGQDRADLVTTRIAEFFEPDDTGRILEPRVTTFLDENGLHVIRLSDRNSPTSGRWAHLLTVTKSDAAAALRKPIADVGIANVDRVAREWTQLLGPALRKEWEVLRARQQQQQPLSIALGAISVVAIAVMTYVLTKISDRGVRYAKRRVLTKSSQNWEFVIDFAAICSQWIFRILLALAAIHFSLSVLPILGLFRQKLYQRVYQAFVAVWTIFTRSLLPNSNVSVLNIAAFIVLACLMFAGARRLSEALKRRLLSRLVEDVGSRESMSIVFKYVLTAFGILLSLPLIGIDLGSLALATGAVGLGIGIGLQNLSRNFISGIVMLFERPIQVGDFVDVDGLKGTIEHINLRATIVRTLDSVNVIVPNARFMEENVVSWSYRDSRCRLHIPVGVAYGSDTEAVKYALLKVAADQPRVLKSPAPQVFFKGFGDSSLDFELLVWTLRPADQFKLVSDLNFAIDAEFRQQAIEIPFPQRDLHIRTTAALEHLLAGQSPNGHTASQRDTEIKEDTLDKPMDEPESSQMDA